MSSTTLSNVCPPSETPFKRALDDQRDWLVSRVDELETQVREQAIGWDKLQQAIGYREQVITDLIEIIEKNGVSVPAWARELPKIER